MSVRRHRVSASKVVKIVKIVPKTLIHKEDCTGKLLSLKSTFQSAVPCFSIMIQASKISNDNHRPSFRLIKPVQGFPFHCKHHPYSFINTIPHIFANTNRFQDNQIFEMRLVN